MQLLILGAGGIGGYYGARIQQAGHEVTFMVRPARAEQLRTHGLKIKSPVGNFQCAPRIVTAGDQLNGQYDAIFLSCKAYDLESALAAIEPAAGPETLIVPFLNGVRHLEILDGCFGKARVLGGLAFVSLNLEPDGEIRHLSTFHRLMIGTRTSPPSPWLAPLVDLLNTTPVEFSLADDIEQEMWNKFVYICTLAGTTCAMRAHVGEILATKTGKAFITGLLQECAEVAGASGHAPAAEQLATYRNGLIDPKSTLAASMLRDIERGGPTEGDHLLGDMFRRGQQAGIATPRLEFAWTHLQTYEHKRRHHRLAS
ncbi:MAG: 2-dehydropantoate 2-reductase [Betaproteobacteria bacterium ADurb.Bin341]|nr:MAG: 2-dehydropantoate 2-reductase [Betaproteobacteria bacterium ADurb.Bin341]